MPKIEVANIHFVKGSVQSIHAAMTQVAGDKNIWIMGGGNLAVQFFDAGLLDEVIVTIASLTHGSGAPLLRLRLNRYPPTPTELISPSCAMKSAKGMRRQQTDKAPLKNRDRDLQKVEKSKFCCQWRCK